MRSARHLLLCHCHNSPGRRHLGNDGHDGHSDCSEPPSTRCAICARPARRGDRLCAAVQDGGEARAPGAEPPATAIAAARPARASLPAGTPAQAKGGPYRPGARCAPHCLGFQADGAPTQRSSHSARPCPSPGISRRTNRKKHPAASAVRRRPARLPLCQCATKGGRERSHRCLHLRQPMATPTTNLSRRSNGRSHNHRRRPSRASLQAENRCVMLEARATTHGGQSKSAARTRCRRPPQYPQTN